MKIYAYVRTSSAQREDSLDAQFERITAWAHGRGRLVRQRFEDDGVSGTRESLDRPGLAEALEALGKGDIIAVDRLDRLARKLHVQEAILSTVWRRGAHVWEVNAGDDGREVLRDDPDDPMRTFVRQVMGAASQLEAAMVTARMTGAKRRKAKAGGYIGGPTVPCGHVLVGAGKEARIMIDSDFAPTLDLMRSLRETHTLQEVADILTKQGIPTARGGAWTPTQVRRCLARA